MKTNSRKKFLTLILILFFMVLIMVPLTGGNALGDNTGTPVPPPIQNHTPDDRENSTYPEDNANDTAEHSPSLLSGGGLYGITSEGSPDSEYSDDSDSSTDSPDSDTPDTEGNETVVLSPASVEKTIGTSHTIEALVRDENGTVQIGKEVTFTVLSGPDAGLSGTVTTGSDGISQFTYTGGTVGTDQIQAYFTNSAGSVVSSNTVVVIWSGNAPTPVPEFPSPVFSGAIIIGMFCMAFFIREHS